MAHDDNRDADTIMATVANVFRRACEAQRGFLDWYARDREAPLAERLGRFGDMVEASEPWAAGYRRISTVYPQFMRRLHDLLLPIQDETFDKGCSSPGLQ